MIKGIILSICSLLIIGCILVGMLSFVRILEDAFKPETEDSAEEDLPFWNWLLGTKPKEKSNKEEKSTDKLSFLDKIFGGDKKSESTENSTDNSVNENADVPTDNPSVNDADNGSAGNTSWGNVNGQYDKEGSSYGTVGYVQDDNNNVIYYYAVPLSEHSHDCFIKSSRFGVDFCREDFYGVMLLQSGFDIFGIKEENKYIRYSYDEGKTWNLFKIDERGFFVSFENNSFRIANSRFFQPAGSRILISFAKFNDVEDKGELLNSLDSWNGFTDKYQEYDHLGFTWHYPKALPFKLVGFGNVNYWY